MPPRWAARRNGSWVSRTGGIPTRLQHMGYPVSPSDSWASIKPTRAGRCPLYAGLHISQPALTLLQWSTLVSQVCSSRESPIIQRNNSDSSHKHNGTSNSNSSNNDTQKDKKNKTHDTNSSSSNVTTGNSSTTSNNSSISIGNSSSNNSID